MFGDTDLPAMFADFGVPVQFRTVTVQGILDLPVQIKLADQGFGGIETELPLVTLAYNAFVVMPTEGDTLNVDGTDYTVSKPSASGDGAVIAYELKAVRL